MDNATATQWLALLFLGTLVGAGYALAGISAACDRDAPARVLLSRWLLLLVWLGLVVLVLWLFTAID